MKRLLIATTALTALAASSALAADIPARMPVKAPVIAPMFNWTGFYLGVNVGGAWTNTDIGSNSTGFIGGGQIGYNWQAIGSPWVLGIEADFQGSTQSKGGVFVTALGPVTASVDLPWFATVRGRLGYSWDRVMIYATGGFAAQEVELNAGFGPIIGTNSSTKTGWTVGGGIEWAFWDRWSTKFEYLYINTSGVSVLGLSSGRIENNIARAGVNYRF